VFSGDSAITLGQSVAQNNTLRVLNLAYNNIGDEVKLRHTYADSTTRDLFVGGSAFGTFITLQPGSGEHRYFLQQSDPTDGPGTYNYIIMFIYDHELTDLICN
jgi:hypothetical protein